MARRCARATFWLCFALGLCACRNPSSETDSTSTNGVDTPGDGDGDGDGIREGMGGSGTGGSENAGDGDGDGDGDGVIDWDAAFNQVFPQDHVVQIVLSPGPDDWAATLDEWDAQKTKSYREATLSFDDESIDSVGFRLKGWSSLTSGSGPGGKPLGQSSTPSGKFPLKIDFDRFGGPRFHDVNKINLSNNWADLSYMRERLSNRIYLAMGVPAARTAYARVRVDGNDNGLYTAVQQIDKCFLEEHFGEAGGDGNLYKAIFTDTDIGSLTWQGDQAADYWNTTSCPDNFPECGIILKTNEDDPERNDYSDLIAFIDVLNHASDTEFEAAIQEVFDVDSFLRLAAVSVTLSSFDGYLGMGHNYYLYHRPDTDKFMMLPWDHNESYAGHPCGRDAIDFDIHDPVCNQRGHTFILADRILGVPAFNMKYLAYVKQLVETVFTEEQHTEWIAEFSELLRPEIATDPNYIEDSTIFERSLGHDEPSGINLGGHGGIEYNLMNFVRDRRAAVLSML